jgi:hypothetical protein
LAACRAVYYFGGSFSPDPTIMPLVIQAVEEHGWDDAFGTYSFLDDLVQTEETLRWVIDRLSSPKRSRTTRIVR